jgi:hypothetical protein
LIDGGVAAQDPKSGGQLAEVCEQPQLPPLEPQLPPPDEEAGLHGWGWQALSHIWDSTVKQPTVTVIMGAGTTV